MRNKYIEQFEKKQIAGKVVPEFRAGDTLKLSISIQEVGDKGAVKTRLQNFEGICIALRGEGTGKTFTVRKISDGIGVERIFPLYSESIAEIKVLRRGKVRRAKLYYLRDLKGKAARIKELRRDNKSK